MTAPRRAVGHGPRLGRHVVARQRLFSRLDDRAPLTVIRAPVGFGKTALLAQWAAQRAGAGERIAWARIRPGVGDDATLWDYLCGVLADCGLPLRTEGTGRHAAREKAERAVAAATEPLVLVVDNVEHLASTVERSLLDLVRYTQGIRLIVAGRSHDRFDTPDIADLDVAVVTAHQLLLTVEETAQACAAMGIPDSLGRAEEIRTVTGGWPGATAAVTRALCESGTEGTETSSLVRRVAAGYVSHRLLHEDARPEQVDFALVTSVPDGFSLGAAAALTDDTQAKLHLDRFEHEGLLLHDTQDGETLYRWPDAARQVLRAELRRRAPERERELHARLARYFVNADAPHTALHHAVEAADWPQAIHVLETSGRTLLFAHRFDELHEAALAMPLDMLATSPIALALRDIVMPAPKRLLLAAARLPAAPDALVRSGRWGTITRTLEAGFMMQIALRRRGLVEHAREYADRILALAELTRAVRPGEIAELYPSLLLQAAVTCMVDGDLDVALQRSSLAYNRGMDNPKAYLQADAAGKTALIHAFRGEITAGSHWLQRHARAPLARNWLTPIIVESATTARLLLALETGDEAGADAAHAELLAPTVDNELWSYQAYAQAQYGLHRDAPADALGLLDRARDTFRARLNHGAVAGPLLAAAEVDLLLALGRANQAHAVTTNAYATHPLLQVGRARLALLTGDNAAAMRLATDTGWDRGATPLQRLHMQLIQAVAAHRAGELDTAEDALRRAVHAARAGGSLRAFATVPRATLDEIAQNVPAARKLLGEAPLSGAADVFPDGLTLIRLTAREQRVLETLTAGLTMQQAADSLVVSVNTVKTQLRSLYRKLGTDSRHDAVALARQWGLLSNSTGAAPVR